MRVVCDESKLSITLRANQWTQNKAVRKILRDFTLTY